MTIDTVINNLQQKETQTRGIKHDLVELKTLITTKLYKSVQDYLAMFPSKVQERDPSEEARLDHQMIRSQLEGSQSLQQLGSQVPLVHMNQNVSLIDSSLQGLSNDVKTLTKQMKEVLKFYSHASSKERQLSQSVTVRGRSVDTKPKMHASNILA